MCDYQICGNAAIIHVDVTVAEELGLQKRAASLSVRQTVSLLDLTGTILDEPNLLSRNWFRGTSSSTELSASTPQRQWSV
jgi:hypothetical protein